MGTALGTRMETILVIEDDPAISLGLQKNLKYEGYDVLTAHQGEKGLELAIDRQPDLIVLDIMLPNMSGFEICKTLKRNEVDIPIIILSAKDSEIDKIMGLDLGADDYMPKPFSPRELVARVNAQFRRRDMDSAPPPQLDLPGDIKVDLARLEIGNGCLELGLVVRPIGRQTITRRPTAEDAHAAVAEILTNGTRTRDGTPGAGQIDLPVREPRRRRLVCRLCARGRREQQEHARPIGHGCSVHDVLTVD